MEMVFLHLNKKISFFLAETKQTLIRFPKKIALSNLEMKILRLPYLNILYNIQGSSSQGSIYLCENHFVLHPHREHKPLLSSRLNKYYILWLTGAWLNLVYMKTKVPLHGSYDFLKEICCPGSYCLNPGRMPLDRPIHCGSFSWVP